jgi:hypothetical protein
MGITHHNTGAQVNRLDQAVDSELAKLARVQVKIDAAVAAGRISADDGEERKARAEQWATNRIAFLSGQPRPRQRMRQPLDDPNAGRV